MVTLMSDLQTGDKFRCRIQGVSVTGTVFKGRGYIHLCQNKKDGHGTITDKQGYKYSWAVPYDNSLTIVVGMQRQAVTHFEITTKKTVKKVVGVKEVQPAVHLKDLTSIDQQIAEQELHLKKLKGIKESEAKKEPTELLGWNINPVKKGGKEAFNIGCGAVSVTREEAASFARIMEQVLRRSTPGSIFSSDVLKDRLIKCTKVAAKLGKIQIGELG